MLRCDPAGSSPRRLSPLRIRLVRPTGRRAGWLALAAAAALAGGPARAEVTVESNGQLRTRVDHLGQHAGDPLGIHFQNQNDVDESSHAEIDEKGRADATVSATVNADQTSASASASGRTDIEHCCTEDENGEPQHQTGAGGVNAFSVTICSDQRATFSASVSGHVQANGEESTDVYGDLCCDALGETINLEADDGSLGRSFSKSITGVLNRCEGADEDECDDDTDFSCVSLGAGASSTLGFGQPTSVTHWTLQVNVVETPAPPGADTYVWVGGPSGAYTEEDNWSPAGGPPGASDTALFTQGGRALVDLATGASRAAGPRADFPVEHVLERTRVNLDPLQPNAGVLRLLSPSLADPSLVVNSGGRLLVDNGSVAAQSALVGEDGLGTVEVTNGNLFQTDGTLVLGRDGEGRLLLTGGANALTDEVVMGEGSEPGNAVVSGAGSLWIAGRLHVSKSQPSTIILQNGGELDVHEALVERAPQGALPNVTIRQTGTWQVDRLDLRGDGFVDCAGGTIEPRSPGTPGEIAVGTGSPGTAQLLLRDECAASTEGDLVIGRSGDGLVTVDASSLPNTSLSVAGTLRAGVDDLDLGNLTVLGSITGGGDDLVAGALEYLGGDLTFGHAARGTVSGPATIGRGPGGLTRHAKVALLGNGPPEVTRLRIDGSTHIGEKGWVEIRNAVLSTGGVVEIEPGGILSGIGADNVVEAVTGILNHGSLWGPLRLAPGTRILPASTGTVVNQQAGAGSAPQLSPLAASAFSRAVRRAAAPPPPPAGVLTFEGEDEVPLPLQATLVIQFRNGFAPGAGDPIQLVETAGTLTGSFSDIVVRGLAPGAQLDVSAAGGKLTAVALADTEALPTVSVAAKPKLKEKKKAGAKVKLTRTGDLSAPLLVSYALRGTARNGIDYDLMPGTVEIPAGKRAAKLALRPRQDGLVEDPETIVLEVLPGDDYAPGLASEVEITLLSKDVIPPPKTSKR